MSEFSGKLAVATIARGHDERERVMVLRTMCNLAELDVPVFVGLGMPYGFDAEIRAIGPQFTVFRCAQFAFQFRSAFRAAAQAHQTVLYLEGDKDYFTSRLIEFLRQAFATITREGIESLLLFGRSASAMATFPEHQQRTEMAVNLAIQGLTGQELEMIYGPKLFLNGIAAHINDAPTDLTGWQPLLWLVGAAFRIGGRIGQVTSDEFVCSERQRQETSPVYRMAQFRDNVVGFCRGYGI